MFSSHCTAVETRSLPLFSASLLFLSLVSKFNLSVNRASFDFLLCDFFLCVLFLSHCCYFCSRDHIFLSVNAANLLKTYNVSDGCAVCVFFLSWRTISFSLQFASQFMNVVVSLINEINIGGVATMCTRLIPFPFLYLSCACFFLFFGKKDVSYSFCALFFFVQSFVNVNKFFWTNQWTNDVKIGCTTCLKRKRKGKQLNHIAETCHLICDFSFKHEPIIG